MPTPTTPTEEQFRSAFPEFSDKNVYPSGSVQFWLTDAVNNVNPDAWGNSTAKGVYLYLAHQLLMKGRRPAKGQAGSQVSGPIASKSVGSVSVSYDTASTAETGAGWWNSTQYGKEFFRLSRIYGSGPIQI
jgi:hypothetical protein